ncbi:MAG: hypothetical protein HYV36_04465 [Lentisphaerae bacterium]|nr:hypothetical protein [Lentisphaerota bacterium]
MKKIGLLALLTAAITGFGATIPMDTLELRLGGQMRFSNAQGKTDWLLESGLGYFVFDNIEFGGITDFGYDGDDPGLGLGGFGEVNLDLDSFVVPYAGMRLQYNFGGYYRSIAEHNYLLSEYTGGLKFFVSPTVAIYTELYFDLASEEAFVRDGEAKNTDAGLKAGVRAYF